MMDWLIKETNEPTALLAIAKLISIIAIPIAGIWALFLWKSSIKNNRDNNELMNQPKFEFHAPEGQPIPSSSENQKNPGGPKQCWLPEINESNELIWFYIKNIGGFAAENLRITLIISQEYDNIYEVLDERTNKVPHLQSGHSYSFHLPIGSISFNKYHTKFDAIYEFYVLLEYTSEYSRKKYKRIYQLEALSVSANGEKQRNWDQTLGYGGIYETGSAINKRRHVLANMRGMIFKKFLHMMPAEVWLKYFWASKK